jgi:hypothetical protein
MEKATIILPCPYKFINQKRIVPIIYCAYEIISKSYNDNIYILLVDGEEYPITSEYLVEGELDFGEQSTCTIGQIEDKISRHRYFVSDMKKQVKDVLGIDIKAHEHTNYNGR